MARELEELRVTVRSIRGQSTEKGRSREKTEVKQNNRGRSRSNKNVRSVSKTPDDHNEMVALRKKVSELRNHLNELSRQSMKEATNTTAKSLPVASTRGHSENQRFISSPTKACFNCGANNHWRAECPYSNRSFRGNGNRTNQQGNGRSRGPSGHTNGRMN